MITAGRNGPSESCQIFLNIGGVLFSFAYTLAQLLLYEIKIMHLILIILAFYQLMCCVNLISVFQYNCNFIGFEKDTI